MTEKPKIIPVPIRIHLARPAFFKLHEPAYPTDKRGQPDKTKRKRFSVTLLLDPTNQQAQKDIEAIKLEAARQLDLRYDGRANWPKADPRTGMGAPIWCFGNGNDLPKVYGGFKDMWYVRCTYNVSENNDPDVDRPLLGAADAREVRLLSDGWHYCDKDHRPTEEKAAQQICPYGGCNARARISLYTFDNQSRGVNANLISLQFVSKNTPFDGRPQANANDEFDQQYTEYVQAQQAGAQQDPFG